MSEARDPSLGSSGTPPAAGPQRLYFHVGLPKSGSTFLQTVLGNHRAELKDAGHVYPYVRQEGMFHAAVEMAGSPERWGLVPEDIAGTFAHLLRRGRRLGGVVLISHEIFGSATRDQIARMAPLLDDFEVHLVLTVRDLGRTATAEWQERVKNGHTRSFAGFIDDLMSRLPEDLGDTSAFWRTQNLRNVLDRWQALVPAQRIHIVTCPPSGTDPDLLWRRFAEAVELRPDVVDLTTVPPRNESLGTAQIAFLRRVVRALDGRLEQPWFARVAKRWFAQTLLGAASGSAKPVTPAPVAKRLAEVSAAWIEMIRAGDFQVHGDLDELLPDIADDTVPHPDDATDADMLAGLPGVVAEMLLRTAQLQRELAGARGRNDELASSKARLESQVAQLTAELEERTGRRHRWAPFRVVRARSPQPVARQEP
ncbi:hypothetical protein [Nocardioides sp. GXQ0305]|uniref:hypothetical protein n=1 Tax=Nocardioides sp. GXQ0305 TaxID=3423912 RepID=UPI003D7CEE55